MLITRRSPRTGQINSCDIPCTQAEYDAWKGGRAHIQDALPNLTPEQREFILTGCTPEDWAALFPPEEK